MVVDDGLLVGSCGRWLMSIEGRCSVIVPEEIVIVIDDQDVWLGVSCRSLINGTGFCITPTSELQMPEIVDY